MSEPIRINRYLARCGVGSRRAVERLILDGRVEVDGVRVTDLSVRVGPGSEVRLDGIPLRLPTVSRLFLFHKPAGTLCTAKDPHGRRTIYDILPPEFAPLRYVGRLDYATRGLLLLTDDGGLARRLTLPVNEVPRLYRARLSRPLTDDEATTLMEGVDLPPELGYRAGPLRTGPCEIRLRDDEAELLLREGKNREVRRMMAFVGVEVIDLIRLAYGPLSLGDLREGEWREATSEEFAELVGSVAIDATDAIGESGETDETDDANETDETVETAEGRERGDERGEER